MTRSPHRFVTAALTGALVLGAAPPTLLAGPEGSSLAQEAGKHFQRGVTLFNEADYRAALVEFRRAYDIAPKTAVLYNIGQTYFQLQSYALALTALQRYLDESPATAAHRAEVTQTIETLRARVGKLAITTNVPGCEILVDDEPAGTTPLAEPLLVSIGRRKITTSHAGRAPDTRFIEVAAGDTATLAITLPDLEAARPVAPQGVRGADLILPGWIATGVLGAGAVTAGVLAYLASRDLDDARHAFPGSPAALDRASSRLSRYALVGDILGIAAVVTGGITLKLTLSRSATHEVHVAAMPNGIQLAGSFQ